MKFLAYFQILLLLFLVSCRYSGTGGSTSSVSNGNGSSALSQPDADSSNNGLGHNGGNGVGFEGRNTILKLTDKNAYLNCEVSFADVNLLKSRCQAFAKNEKGEIKIPDEVEGELHWNSPTLSLANAITDVQCSVSTNKLSQDCSVVTTAQAFESEKIEVTHSYEINEVPVPKVTILIAPKLYLDGTNQNSLFNINRPNCTYFERAAPLLLIPNAKVEVEEGDVISEAEIWLELITGDLTSRLEVKTEGTDISLIPFHPVSQIGKIVLQGPMDAKVLQGVLRTLTYSNSSQTRPSGGIKIYLTIKSQSGLFTHFGIKILYQAVNTPPEIILSQTTKQIKANSTAQPLDAGISLTDVDSSRISKVTVSLKNPESGDNFVPNFVSNSLPQVVSSDSVVMYNAQFDLPVSWFQDALKGLKFSATKPGVREFVIQAEDARGSNIKSLPITLTVEVTAP